MPISRKKKTADLFRTLINVYCLQVDQKKLKKIEDDLINKTEEFTTEVLERIYITLNECVVQYRNVYDRTQLPSELTDRLTSLKVF